MIRKMEERDKDAVIKLAVEFGEERLNTEGREYIDKEAASAQFDQFIRLDNVVAYVADVDGEVVGMIVLFVSPLVFGSRLIAQEVVWYVKKTHRTVGVRLLKYIENLMKNKGCQDIMMVGLDGDRSCEFYERFGYKPFQHSYMKRLV